MKMKENNKLEKIVNNLKQGSITLGKKIVVPSISFAFGAGLGKLGNATNFKEIVAVPIAMDLFYGGVSKNHIIPYLAYGAGVAMNYLPEIYQALQNFRG